jgi:YVTN family beta-propeller protein
LLSNDLRTVRIVDLLDPAADLLQDGRLAPLGNVGRGAADPAGITVVGDEVVIALAGVGEVAVGRGVRFARLMVGGRPTAVVPSPDGRRVFITNSLADSISVFDVPTRTVVNEITLGPQPPLSDSDRGEILFYDGRLSHDGWLSCHSCHTDGHTNGRLSDTLGDGSFGAPKRVLSLLGVKDTGPWAWNGEISDLESQVKKSVHSTMHGPKVSDKSERERVKAISAFLRTLAAPPPSRSDEAAVRRGKEVFARHDCASCHAPPTYTTPKSYDVGLRDEVGNTRFNPPSLRGVAHGGPFFHDGRAATLREVFTKHGHQLKAELKNDELDDLLAFLSSL